MFTCFPEVRSASRVSTNPWRPTKDLLKVGRAGLSHCLVGGGRVTLTVALPSPRTLAVKLPTMCLMRSACCSSIFIYLACVHLQWRSHFPLPRHYLFLC